MFYISGARLVADKQVRIASTKFYGIQLKKAIQVRLLDKEKEIFFFAVALLFLSFTLFFFVIITLITVKAVDKSSIELLLFVGSEFGLLIFYQWDTPKAQQVLLGIASSCFVCNLFFYFASIGKAGLWTVLFLFYALFYIVLFFSIRFCGWRLPLEIAFYLIFLLHFLHPDGAAWPLCLGFILSFFHALCFLVLKSKPSGPRALAILLLSIIFALCRYKTITGETLMNMAGISDVDPMSGLLFVTATLMDSTFIKFLCIEGLSLVVFAAYLILSFFGGLWATTLLINSAAHKSVYINPIWGAFTTTLLTTNHGEVTIHKLWGIPIGLVLFLFFNIFFLLFFRSKEKNTISLSFLYFGGLLSLFNKGFFDSQIYLEQWLVGLNVLLLSLSLARALAKAESKNLPLLPTFLLVIGGILIPLLMALLSELTGQKLLLELYEIKILPLIPTMLFIFGIVLVLVYFCLVVKVWISYRYREREAPFRGPRGE